MRMAAIGTKPDRSRFLEDLAYPMPGHIRTPADISTPATRRETMERPPDRSRLLSEIDFDDPEPVRSSFRENREEEMTVKPERTSFRGKTGESAAEKMKLKPSFREKTERPDAPGTSTPNLLKNVSDLLRSRPTPMKPGKFDGTGSLESFLVQFEVCARHNKWTAADRVDYLRCSLEKAATQLLWDFGAQPSVSYEELVERLRQRYGTEGQAETFRAQLYYRRQRPEENLSDLLHEIRRLVVLAYPVPSNETTQIIAKDSFLEAMRDRELSLKVREREPKTLDEAYRTALRLEAYQRATDPDDRRRQPNRVRGAQESDVNTQLQTQLDRFLATQMEEQRRFQREIEQRIDRQLREIRRGTSMNDGPGRDARPDEQPTTPLENTRRSVTCYNCGRAGHISRNCRQRRRFRNRPNEAGPTEDERATMPPDPVARNNTTRPTLPDRASKNAIYIRGTIHGRSQLCLVDTGSEVSLVPSSTVDGLELRSCNRFLMAANGTTIRVPGEVQVPIKIAGGLQIHTSFLVSDQIAEPMLGMDWLREHRCRLSFGTGALYIDRKRISLVRANGSMWCRRVIVAEEVIVSPRCQSDVPVRTLYGDLTTIAPAWMTEAQEIQPGVHLARVVIDDHADSRVRIVNLSENEVRLTKDQMLGGLHPVEVEVNRQNDESTGPKDAVTPSEMLLADLPDDVSPEIRERLSGLLVEYSDVFSVTDRDLGRTSVCTHKIETGDARPVRQPLRRQPLPHRIVVDTQLDGMLADGIIEPAVSEWAANVVLAHKSEKVDERTVQPLLGRRLFSHRIAAGRQLISVFAVGLLFLFFLIIMGSVTKFVLAIPRDKCEAPLMSRALVGKIVVRHGAPPQVLADRVLILAR